MKRYATYSNAGGIDKVKSGEALTYHDSLADIFAELTVGIKIDVNIRLKYHAFDERINKHVYMLTADHSGHKDQFVCFVIEITKEDKQ